MGPREVEEEGQAAKLTQTSSRSGSSPPSSHLPLGGPTLAILPCPAPSWTPESPGLCIPCVLQSEAIGGCPGGPAQWDTVGAESKQAGRGLRQGEEQADSRVPRGGV